MESGFDGSAHKEHAGAKILHLRGTITAKVVQALSAGGLQRTTKATACWPRFIVIPGTLIEQPLCTPKATQEPLTVDFVASSTARLHEAFAAYQQAIDGIEALRAATETEEIKIGLLGRVQQVYESMVLLCGRLKHFIMSSGHFWTCCRAAKA